MQSKKNKILIPYKCYNSILDIDYDELKESGIKVLFFDIDNTIGPLDKNEPSTEYVSKIKELKESFLIYLFSNSPEKRVKKYGDVLGVDYLYRAYKPFTRKIMSFINTKRIDLSTAICIGDQLLTDLKLANKLGVKCILVSPINPKAEKFYTKINRWFMKIKYRNLKKIDENAYSEIRRIQWIK